MTCKPCAQRRKEWKARQEAKRAKGQVVQAAAIGAALAVTEAVGTAIGINGEVEDGQQHGTTGGAGRGDLSSDEPMQGVGRDSGSD